MTFEGNGKFAQAAKAAEELAQFREQRLGADHWSARALRLEINSIECVQQQSLESQKEYLRTFRLAQKAQAFLMKGQFRDAQPLQEQMLAIRRKVLGEEDLHTAESYQGVAMNLNAQGKYAEAEEGLRKALAIRLKVLGEENPQAAESCNYLALNLVSQGKYALADERLRQSPGHQPQSFGRGERFHGHSLQ